MTYVYDDVIYMYDDVTSGNVCLRCQGLSPHSQVKAFYMGLFVEVGLGIGFRHRVRHRSIDAGFRV